MLAIGIDPGTATGIAVWNSDAFQLEAVCSMGIIAAMKFVYERSLYQRQPGELIVIVEDARKRGVFTIADENEGKYGAGVREGVGSIKRDCAIWEEFLQHWQIPHEMRRPHSTKMKHPAFAQLTGWSEITNKHSRDAAMIVFQLNKPILSLKLRTYEERRAHGGESELSARTRVRRAELPRYNRRR